MLVETSQTIWRYEEKLKIFTQPCPFGQVLTVDLLCLCKYAECICICRGGVYVCVFEYDSTLPII